MIQDKPADWAMAKAQEVQDALHGAACPIYGADDYESERIRIIARAILSVYPLDTFVDDAAGRMEVVGDPNAVPDVQKEVQAVLDETQATAFPLIPVERFAFYARAKKAYCVIQTGERRFYGCFALRKGVVPPDAA